MNYEAKYKRTIKFIDYNIGEKSLKPWVRQKFLKGARKHKL